jgi:nucleoside-diphosphate-sugar epimerase
VREEFPNATIFRPSSIYGNQYTDGFIEYHFSRWVRPMSFLRVPLYASGEKTIKAPIFINDVSNAIYAAIREPMSIGQTYEIYGPERYKLRELIEYCLRYMRRKSVITPLTPDVFAKAIANYFFHKSLYNIDRMQCAYVSDTVTPGLPTIRDLGIEPIKFSDAIGNIMASMRKSGRYVENPEDFLIPDPPKPVTQEFELSYNVSYP